MRQLLCFTLCSTARRAICQSSSGFSINSGVLLFRLRDRLPY